MAAAALVVITALWVPAIVSDAINPGWVGPGYRPGGYSDGYFGHADLYPDAKALSDRQPREVQEVVRPLFAKLLDKPNDELYLLKAHKDVCALTELIDCDGVSSQVIKPFVDSALDLKKYNDSAYRSWVSLVIALGSLVVSLLSLAFAVLAFVRKDEAPKPRPSGPMKLEEETA
jgi:hypothetical protein